MGRGEALKFQKKEGKPMELKFDGLEIRNWNIPTNRAQVVMFTTPGVIVISYTFSSYLALSENGVVYWILSCQ